MISLVRKVVAGPKNTTTYEGEELDLTYITQRVIAMAFPASDLIEKTYRNSIKDVANYFHQHHDNNFMIFNVSSRDYDYKHFDEQVRDYEWPDHQAPPLTTLVHIGYEMFKYLKDANERVVAVHCNHGKGRTGSAIIAFMLIVGYFHSAADCLKFYNSKRFNKNTYGVDQPCQLRYLTFIQQILKQPKINQKLVCYRIKNITHRGLGDNYYVKIRYTRNQQPIFQKLQLSSDYESTAKNKILLADIFIQLFCQNWMGAKRIARINYNMHFANENSMELNFKGKDIKISGDHSDDFQFTINLQYHCLCHLPIYQESKCSCYSQRQIQQKYWTEMIKEIKQCQKIPNKHSYALLHGGKTKSPRKYKRLFNSKQKQASNMHNYNYNNLSKSFSGRNIRSNHQQWLSEMVQNMKLKKLNTEDDQLVQTASHEVEKYVDQPSIVIKRVQKSAIN